MKKNTKSALLLSVVSIIVCCTMLLGTTMAWFTDSVTSAKNVIVAGNLDIELEYSKDMTSWKTVEEASDLFDAEALWEPGHTEVVYLRLSNLGTLALKYQFSINFTDTVIGKNAEGEEIKLSEHLMYGIVDNVADAYATRDAAREAVEAEAVALAAYSANGEMLAKAEPKTVALVIYMPEEVGNEANYRGDAIPQIELGVELLATQLTAESDSFDNQYDKDATMPWDGTAGEVPEEENGVVTITTAAQLAAFAADVNGGNSYSGKTVVLANDIDLGNQAWTPIGDCESGEYFQGTFDGQGNTIYNLYVDKSTDASQFSTAGLFGWVDAAGATVKNLTVDGATVMGSHWVGVIAGYWTNIIENCSVNNATVVAYNVNDDANGDKVGGIVGYLNDDSDINNCTVTNSTIIGNRDIGGIAGAVAGTIDSMSNNKVSDTDITYTTVKDYASAGAIVSGRTGYTPDATNVATNVTINKTDSVTAIATATELQALSNKSTSGTIIITDDIDLNGASIAAIAAAYGKELTIVGNGHKISNATLDAGTHNGMNNYGLFYAYTGSTLTISDLVIENVNVEATDGNYGAAVVIGYMDGGSNVTLDNVDVANCSVKNIYDEAAVYVGYQTGTLNMVDCDSTGCTVEGASATKTGAFIGHVNGSGATLENCTTDLTIAATNRDNGTLVIK